MASEDYLQANQPQTMPDLVRIGEDMEHSLGILRETERLLGGLEEVLLGPDAQGKTGEPSDEPQGILPSLSQDSDELGVQAETVYEAVNRLVNRLGLSQRVDEHLNRGRTSQSAPLPSGGPPSLGPPHTQPDSPRSY